MSATAIPRLVLPAVLAMGGIVSGPEDAAAEKASKYAFDGTISREVLENYLARSLKMLSWENEYNKNRRTSRTTCAWSSMSGPNTLDLWA